MSSPTGTRPTSFPLIFSTRGGWIAEFCDHCQAAWFGIETFPDPPTEEPSDG